MDGVFSRWFVGIFGSVPAGFHQSSVPASSHQRWAWGTLTFPFLDSILHFLCPIAVLRSYSTSTQAFLWSHSVARWAVELVGFLCLTLLSHAHSWLLVSGYRLPSRAGFAGSILYPLAVVGGLCLFFSAQVPWTGGVSPVMFDISLIYCIDICHNMVLIALYIAVSFDEIFASVVSFL